MNSLGIRLCDEHRQQLRNICPSDGMLAVAAMARLPQQTNFSGHMAELPKLYQLVSEQAGGCCVCFQPRPRQPGALRDLMDAYRAIDDLLYSHEEYPEDADERVILLGYEDDALMLFVPVRIKQPIIGLWDEGWFN